MSVKEALKKKKNIFHIILWILTLCALGLIAGLACFKCYDNYFENQFIDATIFGYFIIACLIVVGIFCEDEIPPKPVRANTMLALCFLGAIMYLVTSILLFTYLNKTYFGPGGVFDDIKGRSMGAMIVCILLGIMFLFEFVMALAKPEVFQ